MALRGLQDLSSQSGIKPMPHAVEAQSPNHWTTREVLAITSAMQWLSDVLSFKLWLIWVKGRWRARQWQLQWLGLMGTMLIII